MLKKIEQLLNAQVEMEGNASQGYLAMACWCAANNLEGSAAFFLKQAEEERMHMLKFVQYIDEAGGKVSIGSVTKPTQNFKNIKDVVQKAYKQEQAVTKSIHQIVEVATAAKDYATNSFLQWFIDEQLEEEEQFRGILDKIELIGLEGRGLYFIDEYLNGKSTEAA